MLTAGPDSLFTCPMADIHQNTRIRIRLASQRVLFRTSLNGFQLNFLLKKKDLILSLPVYDNRSKIKLKIKNLLHAYTYMVKINQI